MKKIISLNIQGSAAASLLGSTKPILTAVFERGERYQIGPHTLLNLHGNYREMGRQYGTLLKFELNELKSYLKKQPPINNEETNNLILANAEKHYNYYPQEFKDLIEGMAETSGLSFAEQQLLSFLEFFPEIIPPKNAPQNQCTCIAINKDQSVDGKLIFGRNYDWFPNHEKMKHLLTTTIFHADGAKNATALINYPGSLKATTAMNSHGIFLAINSEDRKNDPAKGPLLLKLQAFLRNNNNLAEFQENMLASQSNRPIIINVADDNEAFSDEYSLDNVKFVHNFFVATNHFVHPDWHKKAKGDTVERRNNVLAKFTNPDEKINLDQLKKILETPIKDGGVSFPIKNSMFRVIAVPQDLKLWLCVPNVYNWTEIDLKPFFKN
ncbi:MAG: C45 family peptidase [Candidatus Margulisiibacteriota bacterium]|jgi:hypothetical protein